jgi:hypothetical protein
LKNSLFLKKAEIWVIENALGDSEKSFIELPDAKQFLRKPRLNFGVIYPSGIVLTKAPSIVETRQKQRRVGHPPRLQEPGD